MTTTITILTIWFLLGITAKGIIRGNYPGILSENWATRKSCYIYYRVRTWELKATLLGIIGLAIVIYKIYRLRSFFSLRRFSLKPFTLPHLTGWVAEK